MIFEELGETLINGKNMLTITITILQVTDFYFTFQQYPHGMKYPHEAGKRPRNKFKNRYAQMFPCTFLILTF